jgi:hypothetical protein
MIDAIREAAAAALEQKAIEDAMALLAVHTSPVDILAHLTRASADAAAIRAGERRTS